MYRATVVLLAFATSARGQSEIYQWHGESMFEQCSRVSRAGDVDLDGCDDVIVGSPGPDQARIYSGATGLMLEVLTHAGFFDTGFGQSVTDLGDVDGDGYPDVGVGAWIDDSSGTAAGSTLVYSGRDGHLIHSIPGETANDHMGFAVSAAGDVDLDGTPDVLSGGWGDDTVPGTYGAARVYSGVDGSEIHEFHGDPGEDYVGWSVTDLGDVDMDGHADVAVGRRGIGDGPGWVRVYSGQSGAIYRQITQEQPWGFLFAEDIANAGDVDGDLIPDLLVGIPVAGAAPSSGLARLYSTGSGSIWIEIAGDHEHDYFGWSVSGSGDVDADGTPDFIVGAPDTVLIPQGTTPRANVYSGLDGALLLSFPGQLGDGFGISVADAGDVNGDGHADVVVGAHNDSELALSGGSATVFSGTKLPLTATDHTLPFPGGGTVTLRLNAGASHGGDLYLVLGSLSGIAPGVPLGGALLPLNLDAYLLYTANHPGAPPLAGSFGALSPGGGALASFTAPAGLPASFHGLTFHHAYVAVDATTATITLASNAVPVSLISPGELH